ncbi:uncharacterized protein VP01_4485g3 [Puccinia sorghi]|uniref:Uncharacterized protein n=1 Tax=Puccinia sorghi TaxID=27349 RepID=A0A0L6UP93_9BASI|nr:uncharacterized protein VP01_4485g3 [Puccinia sorghi]
MQHCWLRPRWKGSSIAMFPYSNQPAIHPPAPVQSKLTTSSSLNKLLINGPDPAKIPHHNFDEAIKDSNDAPVRRSLDKLLNPEDLSPTVLNTALALESAEPMNTLNSQDPDNSGFTAVARNQLVPQNYARAVARWDGKKWLEAVETKLSSI